MKNRILLFIFYFLTLLSVFIACQNEEFILPRQSTDFRNPEALPPDLKAAMKWYKENSYQIFELKTKGNVHPLFDEMEPNWEQTFIRSNKRYKTVESTLKTLTATLFIHPASEEIYRLSGEKQYRQTITRMVIRTDLATGETIGFFMSIIPDPEYLEKTDFHPFQNSYLERDEHFGGIVLYHDLNGTRANGWVYQDGKVVSILPRSDSPASLRTRGSIKETQCFDVYKEVCDLWHVVGEAQGVVVNDYYEVDNCRNEFVRQDCYEVERYVPDNPGIVDPEIGGPGSGGGFNEEWEYIPPVCPICRHSPCVCIKIECDEVNSQALTQTYLQFQNAGVQSKFVDLHKGDSVEWVTVLYDSAGIMHMSLPRTDNNKTHARVTIITSKIKKPLSTIHNHPSGNSPSVQDALTLAEQSQRNHMNSLYVCTPDNRIFALVVTNRYAAKNFYENYQDSLAKVTMKDMYWEYYKELRLYDGNNFDSQIASLYALSTVLNLLGSGIQVMDGINLNGHYLFNLRKGERSYIDGKNIIRRTKCY